MTTKVSVIGGFSAFFGLFCMVAPLRAADPADTYPGMNLIPWPKSIQIDGDNLKIGEQTRIVAGDETLAPLAKILSEEFSLLTGKSIAVAGSPAHAGDIVLRINPALKADEPLLATRGVEVVRTTDGAHTIKVTDQAVVEGFDYRAVAEGSSTLLQLLSHRDGQFSMPKVTIKDYPHADYCALMIDVARQDHPIPILKNMIEVLRLYKVRYLQLHLTDDQGWTFPSTKYPQLGTKNQVVGHAGPTGVAPERYKLEDLKDLVAFAAARGIAIIPEFEVPGHSGAALRSFPEVFDAINPATGQPVGLGCMNMTNEALYPVIDDLIGEMCDVFTTSPYFHFGSDEVFGGRVNLNPGYKAFMEKHGLKTDGEMETYFIRTVVDMIKKRGKKPIKWEGLANSASKDVTVMCWVKASPVANDLLAEGFSVITCPWELEVPWEQWNMYVDNGARLKKGQLVLGATLVAWEQSAEFQLASMRNVGMRQERTWGPDNTPTVAGFAVRKQAIDAVAGRLLKRPAVARIASTFDAPAGTAGFQDAAFAADGIDDTYYLADRPLKAGEGFTLNFEKPQLLYSVEALTGQNGHGLFTGELQVSTGTSFQTVAKFENGVAKAALGTTAVKGIRLLATADQSEPLALREIKFQLMTELAGAVNDPAKQIGAGNIGVLKADATFGPMFQCDLPVLVNGHTLRIDSGGGNALSYSGAIRGDGRIEVNMAPRKSGFRHAALTLAGPDANTFNGTTVVLQGIVRLAKEPGIDALAGTTVVGGQGDNDSLLWANSNQINDNANVTLLDSAGGGATLQLNGKAETFNTLTMAGTCRILTDDDQLGGVLTVRSLVLDGKPLARGVYAAGIPWIKGTGYVVVGDVKNVDLAGKVDHPRQTVGDGNIAVLKGTVNMMLDEAGLDNPILLNGGGLVLTSDAEVGVRVGGFTNGTGAVDLNAVRGSIELAGDASNLYNGPTQVTAGVVKLNKAGSAIAVPAQLTLVGGTTLQWSAEGQLAEKAKVTATGERPTTIDLGGHHAKFDKLTMNATTKIKTGGGSFSVHQLIVDGKPLPAGEYTSANQPWIEGSGAITIDPKIDVKGPIYDPANTIGEGNIANLVENTSYLVTINLCSIDVLTNGHSLTIDSGNGNAVNYLGAIQGTGDVIFLMGPSFTGFKDAPLRLSGPKANTTTGKFLVKKGRVQLEKTAGVDAISGDVTIGGQGFNDGLYWKASDQIKDTVNITLLDTKNSGAAYLNLNGCTETVANLTMTAFNVIKTDGDDAKGGVLTVKSLTIANKHQPAGTYTAETAKWVEGTGKVIVLP